jgi:hypothetical protein
VAEAKAQMETNFWGCVWTVQTVLGPSAFIAILRDRVP